MVALNVTFTESEMEELRAASTQLDISLKSLVRDSVLASVRNRKHLIAQLSRDVAEKSDELNRRLA